MQKGSVGRSVAVDSIAGSAIQQGPNFFLFLLSLSYTAISIQRSVGIEERGMDPFSKGLPGIGSRSRDAMERGRGGSAAAASTIDGTLACRVTISAFARYLSLTFEVVEDLVGLVLAGVGEGV